MQSVDTHDLDQLLASWNRILQDYPAAKRHLLDELGRDILQRVQGNIRSSGMQHGGGHLVAWQQYYVGKFSGYTAVRAVGSREGHRPGKNSPGAITNYTENGHATRPPDRSATRSSHYQARIHRANVSGYHYYYEAKTELETMGASAVHALIADIAQRLEGGR